MPRQSQTIIREEKTGEAKYMMIQRDVVQNPNLSYEAIGMLCVMLSHNNGFKFNKKFLMRDGAKRDKVTTILKELTDAGHIEEREPLRRENGTYHYPPMVVHEKPTTKSVTTVYGKSVSGSAENQHYRDGKTVNGEPVHIISNDSGINKVANATVLDGESTQPQPLPKSGKGVSLDDIGKQINKHVKENYIGQGSANYNFIHVSEFAKWSRGLITLDIGQIETPATLEETQRYTKWLNEQTYTVRAANKLAEKFIEWRGENTRKQAVAVIMEAVEEENIQPTQPAQPESGLDLELIEKARQLGRAK